MLPNKPVDDYQNDYQTTPQQDAGNYQGNNDQQFDAVREEFDRKLQSFIPSVNLDKDIRGLFEVVNVAPTGTPSTVYDQIKIYTNGATLRFYWYDYVGHLWHYVTATA